MADTSVRNNLSRQYQRLGDFPIDRSSLFYSYEDAVKYAGGVEQDERKLYKTSYIGQILAVVTENDVKVYVIDENRQLKPIAEGSGGGSAVFDVEHDDNIMAELDEGTLSISLTAIHNDEIELS